ncbi:two-component system, OmpR family, response regulator RstA [Arsukibacterium tuosuense]|uniref:Two-component system, OmpR family, response regulator RstA n=1 Tax=Arsukibacterium tuosuense TaxID=1323745 RepID=A0A285I8A6_9GAMM|nr:response regulator transcription factor [Arsukibacterium tuosuense]SNY44133.1 two-component system, OmpR family, response regulator RstA [Arsukibacterium tuosuense]
MRQPLLLIVEDDQRIAALIASFLQREGFESVIATEGQQALTTFSNRVFDLVVLDLMLPDIDGTKLAAKLKTVRDCPILMLTAIDDELQEVQALDAGIDDYLSKPVQPQRLLARIKALLRRVKPGHSLKDTSLIVNEISREVSYLGQKVLLTDAEFDLLDFFLKHPNQKISRDHLIKRLRGFDYDGLDRSIDMRVSALRKKLSDEDAPYRLIKTIRGFGYLFVMPGSDCQ